MNKKLAKLLVYATGGIFILYGAAFAFLPVEMALLVTGESPGTPSGLIDFRATYGGITFAMGVALLKLGSRPELLSLGLVITAVVLLAMAGGRILGMILDGTPNLIMYIYLATELVFPGLALYLRRSIREEGNT